MKKISIFKRLLILILVFMLSINSIAAVVSDNDGATFITKAEFDSLKNNFQAQIDSYNTSIDSKIEGAIASYLAGIKSASQVRGSFMLDKCTKFRIENNSLLGESERKLPNIDMRIDIENYREFPEGTARWFWLIVDYIDIYSRANNKMKKNIVKVVSASDHNTLISESATSSSRHYIFGGIIDDWMESVQLVWAGKSSDNWPSLNNSSAAVRLYRAFSFSLGSGYRTQSQLQSASTYLMQLYYYDGSSNYSCSYSLDHMRVNTTCSGENVVVPYVSGWQSSNYIEVNVPGWNNTFAATAYSDKISSYNLYNNCSVRNNTSWVKFNMNSTGWPEVYGRTTSKVQLYNRTYSSSSTLYDELNGVGRLGKLQCTNVYLAKDKLKANFNDSVYTQSNYLTMRDGFPLYYAKKGTECTWKPKFSQMICNGYTRSFSSYKVNVKLAYAPFTDGLACGSKYISKKGETSGVWTTWQTGTDGVANINFIMPEDGWIYAKWYPAEYTEAQAGSYNWMIELDGTNSDNFTYIVNE